MYNYKIAKHLQEQTKTSSKDRDSTVGKILAVCATDLGWILNTASGSLGTTRSDPEHRA